MWCAKLGRFSANLGDNQLEVELSEGEAADAAAAALLPAPPSPLTASRAEAAAVTAGVVEGGAEGGVEGWMEGGVEGGAAELRHGSSGAEEEVAPEEGGAARAVPWPLRWELLRSGCRPAPATLDTILRAWPEQNHSQRMAMLRESLPGTSLVLPRRVPGTVIKYRVRVSAGGAIHLLEPRRDTRTLAHATLGEEAWCDAHHPLPTTRCPLPTAHCPLPTAYYLLPTAYCLLPTAYYLLPTAYCSRAHVLTALPSQALRAARRRRARRRRPLEQSGESKRLARAWD